MTQDAYLGGKVKLWQPRKGYRAGIDAVLLAAAVPASTGQSVLDLGCGAGAAMLCLGARVPGLTLTGVERDAAYASLAARNGPALEVVEADINDLPLSIRERQFDHLMANPPYFDRAASRPSADSAREAAHGAQTPLADWVRIAGKRLKPNGCATFIHRAERLPDLLRAMPKDLGSIAVLPLAARHGRAADRVILRAFKNRRGQFRLLAPLVMHEGAAHLDDAVDDYTPMVRSVLRDAAALEF
nr:methyltransferase [Sulfitobacter aestuariivivens]